MGVWEVSSILRGLESARVSSEPDPTDQGQWEQCLGSSGVTTWWRQWLKRRNHGVCVWGHLAHSGCSCCPHYPHPRSPGLPKATIHD